MSSHYDKLYFEPHQDLFEFAGEVNAPFFAEFIRPTDRVLDFGCSAGYLLRALPGTEKRGVEINPSAREVAVPGITVYDSVASVDDEWADVIVSNHVLEHVPQPLESLRELKSKLKPGGTMVFMVPCETIAMKYAPGNYDQHLYSWSPMAIGNLFTVAGFEVLESKGFHYKWPPRLHRQIRKRLGRRAFDFLSWLHNFIRRDWSQVRVVARKPE